MQLIYNKMQLTFVNINVYNTSCNDMMSLLSTQKCK